MDNDFKNLFSRLDRVKPPIGLLPAVRSRLQQEQRAWIRHKRRAGIFSVLGIFLSLAVLVFAVASLEASLSDSGFWTFLSLLFSDFAVVAAYWQSFVWSLVESLPLLTLAVFFGAAFILAESIRVLSFDSGFLFRKTAHN